MEPYHQYKYCAVAMLVRIRAQTPDPLSFSKLSSREVGGEREREKEREKSPARDHKNSATNREQKPHLVNRPTTTESWIF